MRKSLLVLLACSLPACCLHLSTDRPTSVPTLVQGLEDQTVALVTLVDADGYQLSEKDKAKPGRKDIVPKCAGVWVSTDRFVTALHCVAHLDEPEGHAALVDAGIVPAWDPRGHVTQYTKQHDVGHRLDGSRFRYYADCTVVATDPNNDLALLGTERSGNHGVARLVRRPLVDGEELHVVGHPDGLWWSYLRAYVGAAHQDMGSGPFGAQADLLEVVGPVWFGDSGGGAFDSDGELVGITSWIQNDESKISFFVQIDRVRHLLSVAGTVPR